eukprot:4690099-Prymnesium_polylepis.1
MHASSWSDRRKLWAWAACLAPSSIQCSESPGSWSRLTCIRCACLVTESCINRRSLGGIDDSVWFRSMSPSTNASRGRMTRAECFQVDQCHGSSVSEALPKKTGMQPMVRPSKMDFREGVSPPGSRQKIDLRFFSRWLTSAEYGAGPLMPASSK